MGEVDFDRSATTRLEIDEQQSVLRGEHLAQVRLAVQQLLDTSTLADPSSQAPNVSPSSSRSRAAPGPRRRAPACGPGSPRVVGPGRSAWVASQLVVLIDPDTFGTGLVRTGIEETVHRYVAMTRATQQLVILTST